MMLSIRSAVVVVKASVTGPHPTEASLQKLVADFLPKHAIPSIIVVQTEELPRNANGKTVGPSPLSSSRSVADLMFAGQDGRQEDFDAGCCEARQSETVESVGVCEARRSSGYHRRGFVLDLFILWWNGFVFGASLDLSAVCVCSHCRSQDMITLSTILESCTRTKGKGQSRRRFALSLSKCQRRADESPGRYDEAHSSPGRGRI